MDKDLNPGLLSAVTAFIFNVSTFAALLFLCVLNERFYQHAANA
jgi:hypothetical protein